LGFLQENWAFLLWIGQRSTTVCSRSRGSCARLRRRIPVCAVPLVGVRGRRHSRAHRFAVAPAPLPPTHARGALRLGVRRLCGRPPRVVARHGAWHRVARAPPRHRSFFPAWEQLIEIQSQSLTPSLPHPAWIPIFTSPLSSLHKMGCRLGYLLEAFACHYNAP
jgi:hypothetical protein